MEYTKTRVRKKGKKSVEGRGHGGLGRLRGVFME